MGEMGAVGGNNLERGALARGASVLAAPLTRDRVEGHASVANLGHLALL